MRFRLSHAVRGSDEMGVMEQELFSFMFCVKSLAPYLLCKIFIVRTDHNNLLYLSNSTGSKLVRWRSLLSEFRFRIEHIPGAQNVVADGLTRVFHINLKKIGPLVQYCFKDDSAHLSYGRIRDRISPYWFQRLKK